MTTSVQDSTATPRAHDRQVPPLGGFNLTALKLAKCVAGAMALFRRDTARV